MKLRKLNIYRGNELKNPSVKAEFAECMKDTWAVYPVSFGVDLNDPVGSFLEGASRFGREDEIAACHCCFVPGHEMNYDPEKQLSDITIKSLVTGCEIGMEYNIAFAVHGGGDARVDFVFSNVNRIDGETAEDLPDVLEKLVAF